MKEVAVGIILRKGLVLACQRTGSVAYPLKWEFPGGKLEPDESPQQALRRELKEELAIDATIGAEIHRQEWDYSANASSGAFRVFYHLVESFRGPILNRTFRQVQWVSPEELSRMDILEGNREAVRILLAYAEKNSR
jgi:8-oxo-dGTP diphosphatase